jgi:hypothetical protein
MLPEPVGALVRYLVAVPAALLPRRLWPQWDGWLPMGRAAVLSSLLTFFAAFAVGVPSFLRYAERSGSDVSEAMLTTASAVNRGKAPLLAMPGSHAVSMLALPAFILFTPLGWLTLYLFLTGLYRSIACATDDPHGDPLLGLTHHGVTTALARRRQRIAAELRAAQEGADAPDVLLTGREGGAPEAAYVVVAARVKEGWERGTFVMTADTWYRLGEPFDRRYPDGLRRVYPLIVPGAAEAIRRQVQYTLPELSEGYGTRGAARILPRS